MKDSKKSSGLFNKNLERKGLEGEELMEGLSALASDVSQIDLVDFPDVKSMSEVNQIIFSSYIAGYGMSFIARAVGWKQPNVSRLIKKLDPDGRYKMNPEARKAVLTNMLMSKQMEAVSSMTAEKMDEAGLKELSGVVKDCGSVIQNMNQSKHKALTGGRLDNMMKELEREVLDGIPEAEIEENEEEK